MKVKLASGVEIEPENEAELQMLLRNLGVAGATPEPPKVQTKKRNGSRKPSETKSGSSGPKVWTVEKVSTLYGKLPDLARKILASLSQNGDMSTAALANALKLADVKGLGGSLAIIRRYTGELGLPEPLKSIVMNNERSLILDPDFRAAAQERRAQRLKEKNQQA